MKNDQICMGLFFIDYFIFWSTKIFFNKFEKLASERNLNLQQKKNIYFYYNKITFLLLVSIASKTYL